MRQIFGWTHPRTAERGYTGFAMAFRNDDGSFKLTVRQHQGGVAGEAIDLPAESAFNLAEAILAERPKVVPLTKVAEKD